MHFIGVHSRGRACNANSRGSASYSFALGTESRPSLAISLELAELGFPFTLADVGLGSGAYWFAARRGHQLVS